MAFLRPARLTVAVCLLMTALASLTLRATSARNALTEAQAKAGFLFNCAMFIDWPTAAVERDEITIGIVGADNVATLMGDMQGRKVNGRSLRVRALKPADDVGALQIVFVAGEDAKGVAAVLARTTDTPILTVGERDDFTARGGVVRLYTEQDRLRFEINMTSAERAGLRVSAKMLGLAKIVR